MTQPRSHSCGSTRIWSLQHCSRGCPCKPQPTLFPHKLRFTSKALLNSTTAAAARPGPTWVGAVPPLHSHQEENRPTDACGWFRRTQLQYALNLAQFCGWPKAWRREGRETNKQKPCLLRNKDPWDSKVCLNSRGCLCKLSFLKVEKTKKVPPPQVILPRNTRWQNGATLLCCEPKEPSIKVFHKNPDPRSCP